MSLALFRLTFSRCKCVPTILYRTNYSTDVVCHCLITIFIMDWDFYYFKWIRFYIVLKAVHTQHTYVYIQVQKKQHVFICMWSEGVRCDHTWSIKTHVKMCFKGVRWHLLPTTVISEDAGKYCIWKGLLSLRYCNYTESLYVQVFPIDCLHCGVIHTGEVMDNNQSHKWNGWKCS